MTSNEQTKTIIDNLAYGRYTSREQAIADLIEAGLSEEEAMINTFAMASIFIAEGITDNDPPGYTEPCIFDAQYGQSCEDRINQLVYLGYL